MCEQEKEESEKREDEEEAAACDCKCAKEGFACLGRAVADCLLHLGEKDGANERADEEGKQSCSKVTRRHITEKRFQMSDKHNGSNVTTTPAPDSNTVDVAKSRSILSPTSRASIPPARHSDPALEKWLSSNCGRVWVVGLRARCKVRTWMSVMVQPCANMQRMPDRRNTDSHSIVSPSACARSSQRQETEKDVGTAGKHLQQRQTSAVFGKVRTVNELQHVPS